MQENDRHGSGAPKGARPLPPPDGVWRDKQGAPLDCADKLRLLNASLAELRVLAQESYADGLLMGVAEPQLRAAFAEILAALGQEAGGRGGREGTEGTESGTGQEQGGEGAAGSQAPDGAPDGALGGPREGGP